MGCWGKSVVDFGYDLRKLLKRTLQTGSGVNEETGTEAVTGGTPVQTPRAREGEGVRGK